MRQVIDQILEKVLITLMALMVLNVTWQVLSRYFALWGFIDSASSFTEELARYFLIWVGLLGAAYATGKKMHLAIDLLPSKLTGAKALLLDRVIRVIVIVFALLGMVIGGSRLVYLTFLLGQTSAAIGLPIGYVYLVLPLSGVLIIYYSILHLTAKEL